MKKLITAFALALSTTFAAAQMSGGGTSGGGTTGGGMSGGMSNQQGMSNQEEDVEAHDAPETYALHVSGS